MVEGAADRIKKRRRARTPLAVSRSPWRAADDASVRATVQGGRQSRGAAQDGLAAFASPQLCDTSARARRGHSRDSSLARTFQARDDSPLQSRGDRTDCQDREPPGGSARAAPPPCEARQCGAADAVATPAMARPALEVADILRDHGPAWREANRGHVSLDQLKVMSAIERCRTAALGGHVARCENAACGHTEIAYNSCRNRHCPKCQAAASRQWLADREGELLAGPHFHLVDTLPSELRDVAYQNKRVVYNLLMKAAAETTLAIAADPKRLGARIGITSVLHTWGSALTHHPHVHMIVPGGGLSLDNARWVAARPDFLIPVTVLPPLFRGKMLAMLMAAHDDGELKFFNSHAELADKKTFKRFIAPLRRIKWVVYCKAPFAGPEQVLRYLSRYTHRVAISNRRLVAADDGAIAFRWKDYRVGGPDRWKTMWLHPHEFIRRFLMHVLPKGFHRIRHYGCVAHASRAENIATARALLNIAPPAADPQDQPDIATDTPRVLPCPCPRCGGRMIVIEVFARGCQPRWRPMPIRIDTS